MAAPDTARRLFAREARPAEDTDDGGNGSPASAGSSEVSELLRALLAVNGRIAFPEDRLRLLVSPMGAATQLLAYRLCDGRTGLTDIAKAAGLDQGNFSKTVTRWVEAGIAFRVGPKRFPLHLYPLATEEAKGRATTKSAGAPAATGAVPSRRAKQSAKRAPEPPAGDHEAAGNGRARGADASNDHSGPV